MPLVDCTEGSGAVSVAWTLERSVPVVWEHLTSVPHLPEWLGHARSGGFSAGAALVVDHGDGYLCTSVVDTVDDGRRLGMSWEFPDEPPSRLSITLESADTQDGGERCQLRLQHSGLDELTSSYLPGWLTHLTYFECSLEATPLPSQAFWRLYETHRRLLDR